jgi:hypothetical protein
LPTEDMQMYVIIMLNKQNEIAVTIKPKGKNEYIQMYFIIMLNKQNEIVVTIKPKGNEHTA